MKRDTVVQWPSREVAQTPRSGLDELAREGARRRLPAALVSEADDFSAQVGNVVDPEGRRVVVRTGDLPDRELVRGGWSARGEAAASARPQWPSDVHQQNPPAISTAVAERRRAHPGAVPQGARHQGLRRGAHRHPRTPRRWRERHEHRAPQGGLGEGVRDLVEAGSERHALRVRVGRRVVLPCPARQGPSRYRGAYGSHGSRHQGAAGSLGRRAGEHSVLANGAT